VASVGLSLAAATGSVLTTMLSSGGTMGWLPFVVSVPTLLIGALWAGLLRLPRKFGTLRIGWWLSVPLAMANAGIACASLMAGEGGDSLPVRLAGGFVLGASFGAFVWIPALLLTLLFFGVPIAWSQKLAAKGLAGAERGEMVVGIASALVSLLSVVVLSKLSPRLDVHVGPSDTAGLAFLVALAASGFVAGVLATALAIARQHRRSRFVAEVSEGKVQGFRVDESAEGKVLIRVTSMGEGYRVADFHEELYALDEQGEAKHALHAVSAERRT
jgi:hypothetical protein